MELNSNQSPKKGKEAIEENEPIKEQQNIIVTNNTNNTSTLKEVNMDKKIIERISRLLSEMCEESKKKKKNKNVKNEYIKPFLSKIIPTISIQDYIGRFRKYTKISPSTFVIMLIYIGRFSNICKINLSFYNIHKLILSAIIVAIKYNEDENLSFEVYSKIGGVNNAELVNLEYKFISYINYNLFITDEIFDKFNNYISSPESDDEDDIFDDNDD